MSRRGGIVPRTGLWPLFYNGLIITHPIGGTMIQPLESRQMLSSGPIVTNDPGPITPGIPPDSAIHYYVKMIIDRGATTARITYVFPATGYTVQTLFSNAGGDVDGMHYVFQANIQ